MNLIGWEEFKDPAFVCRRSDHDLPAYDDLLPLAL